jgi:hypothetical protein
MDKGPEFSPGFFLMRSNGFFGLLQRRSTLEKEEAPHRSRSAALSGGFGGLAGTRTNNIEKRL